MTSTRLHTRLAAAKANRLLFVFSNKRQLFFIVRSFLSWAVSPQVWGNIVLTELFKDHYKQAFAAA